MRVMGLAGPGRLHSSRVARSGTRVRRAGVHADEDELVALSAQNPFERLPDGRPKVPDALIERARGLSAEDILGVLPGKGFRNQYEDGFELLHPGTKLVGRAFTAQFMPMRPDVDEPMHANAKAAGMERLSNQTVIDMLQPGDVLVVDLFGKKEGGTIVGDNLFYYVMKATKAAGLVVDGAVRDLEGIARHADARVLPPRASDGHRRTSC